MTEHDTLAALARDFHRHEDGCAAESAKTRQSIEALTKAVEGILGRMDGFNRAAWKAVGAVCIVLLGVGGSVIAADINARHAADRQAQAAAQTVAEAARTVSTQNKQEILKAITSAK